MTVPEQMTDRATAALAGLAIGDALGMPSQAMTRSEITNAYGRITDFVAPITDHPISHGLPAASVTDDTEQTLLLAKLLIRSNGRIDDHAWARALMDWETDVRQRGLRDLLGPSTKKALDALLKGVPVTATGCHGTTNGAAMRITPVAIALPSDDAEALVAGVEKACRVTHNTREAIAAAAAVAMVVSRGIGGADFEATLPDALATARLGGVCGAMTGEADMAGRIEAALAVANRDSEDQLAKTIGTSVASYESVATAFGVVQLAKGDPWQAAEIAANIGDDTDTIGAIACAMAGACSGLNAFPNGKIDHVVKANRLDLDPLVRGLLSIRNERSDGAAR
ncbi:MAG: ADP-ribosylglycohydrolase family protein [Pseudomonadota bacterium]